MTSCTKCGTKLRTNAKFCHRCGIEIKTVFNEDITPQETKVEKKIRQEKPIHDIQEIPDVDNGFRFDFISYKKEGQWQWNFLFSESSVLHDKIYLDDKGELVASAIEIAGSSVIEMFYQIDDGDPIRMHVTKIDDRDPIEKNIIPQGWKASLDTTKISAGKHKIVFKAADSQGRCIEKSIKFFKEDVRIEKLKKQREFEKFTLWDELGGGILCLVIGIVFYFVMIRVLHFPILPIVFLLIIGGIFLLLFGVPYHAFKSYKLKRQIKKLKREYGEKFDETE